VEHRFRRLPALDALADGAPWDAPRSIKAGLGVLAENNPAKFWTLREGAPASHAAKGAAESLGIGSDCSSLGETLVPADSVDSPRSLNGFHGPTCSLSTAAASSLPTLNTLAQRPSSAGNLFAASSKQLSALSSSSLPQKTPNAALIPPRGDTRRGHSFDLLSACANPCLPAIVHAMSEPTAVDELLPRALHSPPKRHVLEPLRTSPFPYSPAAH